MWKAPKRGAEILLMSHLSVFLTPTFRRSGIRVMWNQHGVLITDIDENGYYTYIDPVTTIETAGEKKLEDSGFDRFYNIVYR